MRRHPRVDLKISLVALFLQPANRSFGCGFKKPLHEIERGVAILALGILQIQNAEIVRRDGVSVGRDPRCIVAASGADQIDGLEIFKVRYIGVITGVQLAEKLAHGQQACRFQVVAARPLQSSPLQMPL